EATVEGSRYGAMNLSGRFDDGRNASTRPELSAARPEIGRPPGGGAGADVLDLRAMQRDLAEVVCLDPQRPVRLGVVVLVRDVRRQLDDLALREQPLQLREELVRHVDGRRAHTVRIFQREQLALRQIARLVEAERDLDLLPREAGLAADGGIDVHSEGTAVEGSDPDADQLDEVAADRPSPRAEDRVGYQRGEHRARSVGLNLGRGERAANGQAGHSLNDARQNAGVSSFERSNSGHQTPLPFGFMARLSR